MNLELECICPTPSPGGIDLVASYCPRHGQDVKVRTLDETERIAEDGGAAARRRNFRVVDGGRA